jgi:hypothetical protein
MYWEDTELPSFEALTLEGEEPKQIFESGVKIRGRGVVCLPYLQTYQSVLSSKTFEWLLEYKNLGFEILGAKQDEPELLEALLPVGWSVQRVAGSSSLQLLDERSRPRVIVYECGGKWLNYGSYFVPRIQVKQRCNENQRITEIFAGNLILWSKSTELTESWRDAYNASLVWLKERFPWGLVDHKLYWELTDEELLNRARSG